VHQAGCSYPGSGTARRGAPALGMRRRPSRAHTRRGTAGTLGYRGSNTARVGVAASTGSSPGRDTPILPSSRM
jgi:hypothetical protein